MVTRFELAAVLRDACSVAKAQERGPQDKACGVAAMKQTTTVLALLLALAPPALAQFPDGKGWDETLAAARAEGKVAVAGPPDTLVRQALPAAFRARYGIALEYISARSTDSAIRLRAERAAGIYAVDAAIAGIQTMATVYYREKMLDPLRPVLILPEVVEGSHWKKGMLWFADPEQEYVLRIFNTVNRAFTINSNEVKPDELKFHRNLLDPKWKGRISFMDPTVSGTGSNQAAQLYAQLGEDFVRRLFIDQKPMISRDRRQLTDGLARGTYPIAFGAEDGELQRLRKEGLPVTAMYGLEDMQGSLSSGDELALFNHAPHPNAARIFVNWMAGQEGVEVFGHALAMVPARNDVDESVYLPQIIPRSGVDYFDPSSWDFTVTTKEQIRLRMKVLLQGR
jgi:iron(III) transport system substrate-binding protein